MSNLYYLYELETNSTSCSTTKRTFYYRTCIPDPKMHFLIQNGHTWSDVEVVLLLSVGVRRSESLDVLRSLRDSDKPLVWNFNRLLIYLVRHVFQPLPHSSGSEGCVCEISQTIFIFSDTQHAWLTLFVSTLLASKFSLDLFMSWFMWLVADMKEGWKGNVHFQTRSWSKFS